MSADLSTCNNNPYNISMFLFNVLTTDNSLDKNIGETEEEVTRAFVDFLWSREAQEAFARYNFRVWDLEIMEGYADRYKRVELPFTVDYLGGWEEATSTIIDQTWRQIQREIK